MEERVVVVVEAGSPNQGEELEVKETGNEEGAKAGS